ncbi:uncharacterized protein MONOS_13041 [Monocercomonoides exilis]|uniref:uncharacterized protein n=1 Tax=Monocercomonoides exilis TaxID=2049356 RepID=UPI003559DD10|nr:hypothetical protein MONOS_13041 [Monocercomonoides exilis]|eukprot:MONOS_13041.1-p1 / transcript=MONOS_13041.1 / gene=MONOS_13041 / organism=Monocercomonoides_exilis_PA203 / gene_product=unspecified product / transcript_product=unspecified product / location=Mono_scaffold00770:14532-14999(-) / protein_length=156 / sequence_SO=supercontig / SO=protein_coding / is_pseudo=false
MEKILADLSDGSAGWEDGVLPSQLFWGFFVYAAVGEVLGVIEEGCGAVEDDLRGGTVPKKICGGVAVGWYVPEEFPGCELHDFLYCNTVLFEGEQQQLPMKEKEDFLTMSLRMCRMCINIVLKGELGKKIKLFLGELEEIKSDKGEADAYVFLGL